MTQPTKESLDRARTCAEEIGDLILEAIYQEREGWKSSSNTEIAAKALALEFDRVRLEGKIEACDELRPMSLPLGILGTYAVPTGDINYKLDKLRVQLAEHPRQGTALTQPAGEKEG